ncbi:MAG: hypothetical protein QOJ66_622 [Ilumatobacteraceae bacterium]
MDAQTVPFLGWLLSLDPRHRTFLSRFSDSTVTSSLTGVYLATGHTSGPALRRRELRSCKLRVERAGSGGQTRADVGALAVGQDLDLAGFDGI